jgi:hypothetical protein
MPVLFSFSIPFAFFLVTLFHPLHVSVTEIEMNDTEKRLQIMMRVFMDDLEVTLRKEFRYPELDILDPKEATLNQMMGTYLSTHFKISLDNKPQTIKYLGHEQEGDAFIFFIEVANVRKWKTIQVQNDIIMEVYNDQSNLVHVTVKETVRSLRLTRNIPVDKLTFDIK